MKLCKLFSLESDRESNKWGESCLMGVSGLTPGHRRYPWGPLDLGSRGACVCSAHPPVVRFHWLSCLFRQVFLVSGCVLLYWWLLVWLPADFVANGDFFMGYPRPHAAGGPFPVSCCLSRSSSLPFWGCTNGGQQFLLPMVRSSLEVLYQRVFRSLESCRKFSSCILCFQFDRPSSASSFMVWALQFCFSL